MNFQSLLQNAGIGHGVITFIGNMYPEMLKKDIHEIIEENIQNGAIRGDSLLGIVLKKVAEKDRQVAQIIEDTVIERVSKAAGYR